ncbi:GNAT family N-acetyltransferase [Photobacterium japonica]
MEFIPVDLKQQLERCLAFRKDAYAVSYGHLEGFDPKETNAWFERLADNETAGFFHVVIEDELVGQLEFKGDLDDENGERFGYINLVYLTAPYRNQGLGKLLLAYIFENFHRHGCRYALLRYAPANIPARTFYRKHGWLDVGAPNARGQLARKTLVNDMTVERGDDKG